MGLCFYHIGKMSCLRGFAYRPLTKGPKGPQGHALLWNFSGKLGYAHTYRISFCHERLMQINVKKVFLMVFTFHCAYFI